MERLSYTQDACRFKSCTADQFYAGIVQLVERLVPNQKVAGSIPVARSNFTESGPEVGHRVRDAGVVGSIPTSPTLLTGLGVVQWCYAQTSNQKKKV